QGERLDVLHERPESEAATVDVRGQAAAQGEPVGAGLLLADSPARPLVLEVGLQESHEGRPLDAGLRTEETALKIEVEDAVHARHVDLQAALHELLTTHGVPTAAHGDG